MRTALSRPWRLAGYAAGGAAGMWAYAGNAVSVKQRSRWRPGMRRLRDASEKAEERPPVLPIQLRPSTGERAIVAARNLASRGGLHRHGRIRRRIVRRHGQRRTRPAQFRVAVRSKQNTRRLQPFRVPKATRRPGSEKAALPLSR